MGKDSSYHNWHDASVGSPWCKAAGGEWASKGWGRGRISMTPVAQDSARSTTKHFAPTSSHYEDKLSIKVLPEDTALLIESSIKGVSSTPESEGRAMGTTVVPLKSWPPFW